MSSVSFDHVSWGNNSTDDNEELILAQNTSDVNPNEAYLTRIDVLNPFSGSDIESRGYDGDNTVVVHDFLDRLNTLENNNVKLENTVKKLRSRVREAEDNLDNQLDYIFGLEKQLNRLDQYGRRENVEVIGIPANIPDDKLEDETLKILHVIGLKHLQKYDIVGCHRIGPKNKYGSRNTIIRFLHRKDAINCLKLRKNLYLCKSLGYGKLLITENLCPAFKSIFENLTHLRSEGKIEKVWSFNGTVNYIKRDDEHPIKVYHIDELENLYEPENLYNISGV